jgi:monoterpene epsilon-lactone hydrolase
VTTSGPRTADGTPPDRPSLGMKLVSALLGARARRQEGRPVDLVEQRRLNDRISARLRVPEGLVLTEEVVGGVPVVRLSSGGRDRGTVLYLHGGAYVLGAARQALAVSSMCTRGGPDVVSVEYRLAPEHPHPAAVDDAIAVYRELLGSIGASRLLVAGDSAGGGLLLLMLQRARDEGLPMPVAAVTAFPWADLSMSGPSGTANIGKDLLVRSQLLEEAAWFAGDRDLNDPAVSPLHGSFRGFPRTHIAVGTRDLLLDDSRRVAAAMAAEGVDVVLREWPGAIHAFTALPLPEGRRYRQQLRSIVHDALPRVSGTEEES